MDDKGKMVETTFEELEALGIPTFGRVRTWNFGRPSEMPEDRADFDLVAEIGAIAVLVPMGFLRLNLPSDTP